jgi:predicted N-formylglutamate amidohydrolase
VPDTKFEDIATIPGICEVSWYAPTAGSGTANLLIEVPHGATRSADFHDLRARLTGALPDQLDHFFHVNTDIGAPECAAWIAEALAALGHGVLVLRCAVPRTFIDCNRVAAGAVAGVMIDGMTPAVASYISEPADRALLETLHFRYHELVARAYTRVCGRGGLGMQFHSYAPRSVGIDRVDGDIVAALHRAYEPEVHATWPERPEVDLICAGADDVFLAAPGLVAAVVHNYAQIGVTATQNATYRLHPATMGYHYARTYPHQVLCIEVRRDLVADPFVPFGESPISPEKVARMSTPVLAALRDALAARAA